MLSRKIKVLPLILSFSLFAGFACHDDNDDDDPAPAGSVTPGLSLAGTVDADARFSTLKTALVKADLAQVLEQGEYTVFAPTNDAFAKIPSATLNALLNDKAALTQVLLYHVVPGTLKAQDVLASKELKTANDFKLAISTKDNAAYVNSSKIISTDILAKNGVIHAIDTVLTPPSIADLVVADARFTTLKTALVAAGLVDTLKSGAYTVFAPTNEAFAKLDTNTLNAVLADKAKLTSILLYHVVPSTLKAEQVLKSATLTTAQGQLLKPELRAGVPYINDAKILQTDIQAANGEIHVIDSVLLPK